MRLAWLVVLAALPAFAQAPSQFRSSAPITLAGSQSLQEIELPIEAFRDGRRDLGDVRIFNAKGDAVPFAWSGAPAPQLEAAPPIELPLFPVSTIAPTKTTRDEVTVRTADGTLVAIRGKPVAAATVRPAAYLLDASQAREPLQALVFDWKAEPGTQVVTVRVEASDDLKSWRSIAAGPLVKLESAGRSLLQPRVTFTPSEAKYYRVTWDAPGFAIASVRGEHEPRGKTLPRRMQTVIGNPGQQPGDYVFDLGARLAVEALRLIPAEPNSILATTLYLREDESAPWRPTASASFFRLQHEGAEVRSPPIEIGRRPARQWLVRLAPGSSAGAAPSMEVQWRSSRLVFVAQGEGPFHLAFGNVQAASTALPLTSVVPLPSTGAVVGLGEASVGPVRAGPPPTRWEQVVGDVNPRRITLWTILFAGVAALGFMAWRLSRQMKRL